MRYVYDGYKEHECRLTYGKLKHPYYCYEQEPLEHKEEQPEETSFLAGPVSLLEMSTRSTNACKRNGLLTVEQVIQCSEICLLEMEWLGEAAVKEIKDALAKFNLKLANPSPSELARTRKGDFHKLPREGWEFESMRRSDV